MLDQIGIAATPLDLLPDSVARSLRERTQLALHSTGDGRSFEFVWTVPLIAGDGSAVGTAVHAGTGRVIATWRPNPQVDDDAVRTTGASLPSCEPWSTVTFASATVVPQNDNVSPKPAWAAPSPDLSFHYGSVVSHEGHLNVSTLPEIVTYFGVNPALFPGDQCPEPEFPDLESFRRLPTRNVGSQRRYEDWFDVTPPIPGRAAGDAFLKTHATLTAFKSWGWNGFDRLNLIVNSSTCEDNAGYIDETDQGIPAGSVKFCRVSTDGESDLDFVSDVDGHFLHSAALDVVAHELGHGMILTAGIWEYNTRERMRLHEGWADILGHMVEWAKEGSGTGFEREDWMFGEDIRLDLDPIRRVDADADDGVGGYSLHEGDPPQFPNNQHQYALRLPMAFRLTVTGGYNPVCARLTGLLGCAPTPPVPARSLDEMGQVFFRALIHYGQSMGTYNDLSYHLKLAANDIFAYEGGVCTNGYDQQRTVGAALTAIGHPGSTFLVCTCGPTC